MPAACATSSTLTSAKPWVVNSSMAMSVMCCGVVERRLPTRDCGIIRPGLPLRHSMPYCVQIDRSLSSPNERRRHMEHETETDTELVTETLVEEVSIDGMCGVY